MKIDTPFISCVFAQAGRHGGAETATGNNIVRNSNYCAGMSERRSGRTLERRMRSNADISARIVSDADRRIPSTKIADVRALLCIK